MSPVNILPSFTILAFLMMSNPVFAQPSKDGITTCNGEYALCAASTCKPTGKTITGSFDGMVEASFTVQGNGVLTPAVVT